MNMCFHFPIDMCTCVHVYTCRPGPWSSRFLFIKKLAEDSFYLKKGRGKRSVCLAQNNYNPDNESNNENSIFGRRWPTPHKIALAPLI